jgi:hypothetical protein
MKCFLICGALSILPNNKVLSLKTISNEVFRGDTPECSKQALQIAMQVVPNPVSGTMLAILAYRRVFPGLPLNAQPN